MPLCAKCQQNEATIHFTTVVDGAEQTVHFCKGCAPLAGLHNLDPKELEALSVIGKKCEFCGREAVSGVITGSRGAIYWCLDCGLEFGRILSELCISERPDLMKRSKEASSFLSICSDPELQAWSEAANQRAAQILKRRRRKDARDKGS